MLKTIIGNMLDVKYGILCHQVNCQLVMGAGIAKQLRDKWPRVFDEYKQVMSGVDPYKRLGATQMVEIVHASLYVANLFGQFHYLPRGKQHTDYNALASSLFNVNKWRNEMAGEKFPIYVPYMIGCGLGGGSWGTVSGIIESIIPDAIVVKLNR